MSLALLALAGLPPSLLLLSLLAVTIVRAREFESFYIYFAAKREARCGRYEKVLLLLLREYNCKKV